MILFNYYFMIQQVKTIKTRWGGRNQANEARGTNEIVEKNSSAINKID